VNWGLVLFILGTLILADLLIVSAAAWGDGFAGLFRPALPPTGVDTTDIGAVAGFAAMASGLNYVFMNYYRDKGYGMGGRAGSIPALLGGERHEVAAVGTTFRETPGNSALWQRWWRFLILEMWAVFVPGAVIGILMPGILVSYLQQQTGTDPTRASMPTYVAAQLEKLGEPRLYYWSANMSNLAAVIMPFALMYLISRLPRPAKGRWWSYLVLGAVVVYFGFFFANFLTSQLTGGDLSFW
jgi:hypothetical protein